MTTITEAEFARICLGIADDRDSIIKHNPIGPPDEVLLWMLLSCLTSYLDLSDLEIPCFNGKPNVETYRNAISFILNERRLDGFDADKYLDTLTNDN